MSPSDGSAATVTLSGAASGTTTTDNLGNYSFAGPASGNYTVTPSKSQFCLSPSSQSRTISTSDVTGVTFTASQIASETYGISGTISSAANGAGVTIALAGAASASATTDSSGNYTFNGLAGGRYTLTPSKSAYSSNPASQTETVCTGTTNVTGVDFVASRNPLPPIPASEADAEFAENVSQLILFDI